MLLRALISHVRRSLPVNKVQSFLDSFQFESMFKKEDLYYILIQIIIALKSI